MSETPKTAQEMAREAIEAQRSDGILVMPYNDAGRQRLLARWLKVLQAIAALPPAQGVTVAGASYAPPWLEWARAGCRDFAEAPECEVLCALFDEYARRSTPTPTPSPQPAPVPQDVPAVGSRWRMKKGPLTHTVRVVEVYPAVMVEHCVYGIDSFYRHFTPAEAE